MITILLLIIIILILIDVFFAMEFPTHIAYILLTFIIVSTMDSSIVTLALLSILIWFAWIVFHYMVWRKLIERIHDRIVSPRKHIGGIEALIGKQGVIKEIEGVQFIFVNEELYEFESDVNTKIIIGHTYNILEVKSNKLLI